MNYVDPRMSDPAYRARTWSFLAECTARGEQLRQEEDERIREAGPRVGDLVHITPLQLARVTAISGSPPVATIAWEAPTGRAGGTAARSEQRAVRDLVAVFEQPAGQEAGNSLLLGEVPAEQFDAGIYEPGSESNTIDA